MDEKTNLLPEEAALVERAREDDAAFETLYSHYFPRIYAFVFKRVGSREDAEDIVSDVFLKAFANLKNYRSRGFTFGAWLYRIATNRLIDRRRSSVRRPEVLAGDDLEKETDGKKSDSEAEKGSDRLAIEKVLAKLPVRYREAVYLRFFAEMEIYEVAESLKISKTNASVLLHRALEAFRKEAARTGIKFFILVF